MTTRKRKSVKPPARPSGVPVVFAYRMTLEGVTYAPDATAELPAPVAREMVRTGRARLAEKKG